MTPEENAQRGDAADELFRRMKREIAESRPERQRVAGMMSMTSQD